MDRMLVWRLVETQWGWCAVVSRGQGVLRSCLPEPTAREALGVVGIADEPRPGEVGDDADPDLLEATRHLAALFAGEIPAGPPRLDLGAARPYTRDVLLTCSQVPCGQTVTYGELAARAGHPGTARAVGQVMSRNPLAPLVPCHRVIGTGGRLVGFFGGLDLKARLLALEHEAIRA